MCFSHFISRGVYDFTPSEKRWMEGSPSLAYPSAIQGFLCSYCRAHESLHLWTNKKNKKKIKKEKKNKKKLAKTIKNIKHKT